MLKKLLIILNVFIFAYGAQARPKNLQAQNNFDHIFAINILPYLCDIKTPEGFCDGINELLQYRQVCRNWNSSVKKFISKNKINVNLADDFGRTALHFAAQKCLLDVAKVLIDNGADVNALTKTPEGDEKLDPFEQRYQMLPGLNELPFKICPKLINNIVTVLTLHENELDSSRIKFVLNNCSPLHFAILKKDIKMIDLLILSGYKTNLLRANLVIYFKFLDRPYTFCLPFSNFDPKWKKRYHLSYSPVIAMLENARYACYLRASKSLFRLVHDTAYLENYRNQLINPTRSCVIL